MIMKKVILMMAFVLPLAMMAQTRPSPAKKPVPSERVSKKVNYMEMKYSEEMVGKKGSKELKKSYSFNSTNSSIDKRMTESSRKFATVVDALNYLSSMGWELVSVSDEKYYFKNVKGKPPVKR